MIRSADFRGGDLDLVPVAIVGGALAPTLAGRAEIVRGWDDLDWYDGADFILGQRVPVSLRHYDGHPADTFTIYIDRVGLGAAGTLAQILGEFGIAAQALTWVRQAEGEDPGRRSVGAGGARPSRSVA